MSREFVARRVACTRDAHARMQVLPQESQCLRQIRVVGGGDYAVVEVEPFLDARVTACDRIVKGARLRVTKVEGLSLVVEKE